MSSSRREQQGAGVEGVGVGVGWGRIQRGDWRRRRMRVTITPMGWWC
jgi:hypothetical protein